MGKEAYLGAEVPDVRGWLFVEAVATLGRRGIYIRICVDCNAGRDLDGDWRVLRQVVGADGVAEVLVARRSGGRSH